MTFTDHLRNQALGVLAMLRDECVDNNDKDKCKEAIKLIRLTGNITTTYEIRRLK